MRTSCFAYSMSSARAAHDADLAHLPGHQRGVRGRPAELGEEPLGRGHALDVLGAGLVADQQQLGFRVGGLALVGVRGEQDHLAGGGARARLGPVATIRPSLRAASFSLGSNTGRSRSFSPSGSTRASASSGVISPSSTMSTAILHGGEAGALAVAGLQHPELLLLDGELDVLHVAVVLVEHLPDG